MNATLTADHLRRRALVYVRQSTAGQVLHGEHAARRRRTSRNDAGAARQTVIRKGGMRKGERRQGKGRPRIKPMDDEPPC